MYRLSSFVTHSDDVNCSLGNGSVEFNEFIVMMSLVRDRGSDADDDVRRQKQEAEVLQAFRVFDIDGDGLIDPQELKLTMSNLGEVLTDTDIRAMIRAADRNDDGKIDLEGLTAFCEL